MAEPIFSGRTLNIRDLNEVIAALEKHHYSKTSYHQLGLRLKLSHNTLEKIKKDHGEVDPCFTECLASWLRKADGVETPTIDTLITALRGIGENAVADGINEERQVAMSRSEVSDRPALATPQTLPTSESVRNLECRIDQVDNLRDIANELHGKYVSLALAVKKSLESNCINIEDAKFLIKEFLKRKAHVVRELMPCIDILKKVNDFESFFEFLSDFNFIGYLNYKLLKKLVIEFVKDDIKINQQFLKYEEEYAKLLSAASFQDLIPFFEKQSDLSPTAPLGLPYISFRLGSPWLPSRFYTWASIFCEFSWSYYAILKQLRENCIIITYAILPCVLDDVMRDLKDPVILKKLEENDITVFELPQEEEEDFDGKQVDASSIIQTTSSEGNIPTTSTTTLVHTSEANQQEVPLFKQRPEAASIRKEVRSSSLGRELIMSIESDTKPEEVIGLLEAGADPNATNYSGGPSVVMTAIKKNNIGIVEVLLEKGADPNIADTYGGTPLHCASETGNANIIKLLITKGKADVNAVDKRNRTPLFNAVERGSIEAVDILLTNGARTDVVSNYGETLLHCAGKSGKVEMLEFWIKRGDYDVNVKDEDNRTPLFVAVERGSIEAVDILLTNGARTDVENKFGDTPLLFAARDRSNEIIKLLITKGQADVTAACKKYDINPELSRSEIAELLIIKLQKGRDLIKSIESDTKPEEVIGLLEAGADPNVTKFPSGNFPALIIAIEKGNTDIVKLLLEKGADPNVTEYSGGPSALIKAIKKNNIGIVEVLLEKEADPNIGSDTYEGTPLHCASETGNANIIKLLITKGKADVNAVDKHNITPLFKAVASGSIEAVDILLTNGARTDVVSEGSYIAGIFHHGTPLHCASETGNADLITLLITKGKADVNAVDKHNSTPLFKAVASGSIEAVDILLTNGARTDVVDKYGDTPLLLAVKRDRSSTQAIKLLIIKGEADVTAACKKYHINPELSRSEIAELLITKMHMTKSMSQPETHEIPTGYDDEMLFGDPLLSSSSDPESQWMPVSSPMLVSSQPERRWMSSRPERLRYYEEQSSDLRLQTRRHPLAIMKHSRHPFTSSVFSSRPERKQMSTSHYDDETSSKLTEKVHHKPDETSAAEQEEAK